MVAGSRDRPPMLATGRYPQCRSWFLRYIDTRPNGEALRKCILSGPYKPTTVLVQAVAATDDSPAIPEHTIEMWEAIERLQQGESLNIQDVKTNFFGNLANSPLMMEKQWNLITPDSTSWDKDMQNNLALIAKYFKKIYKPTNNNLKTSSNSRNKNVDTTLRYKNDNQSKQFGNQRTVNVVGARENETMTTVNQGMSVKEIKRVVAQQVANAIKEIAIYEAKTNIALKTPATAKNQQTRTCYECRSLGHYKSVCPIVKFHKHVDMIHGRMRASKTNTTQDAIEITTKLRNKKISTLVECQNANKKRLDNTSKNNQNQQQPNKRQNTGRAYIVRHGEKKHYSGSKPLCFKCNYHHDGPCAPKCHKCNRFGHLAHDCRSSTNANTTNIQKGHWSKSEGYMLRMWKSKALQERLLVGEIPGRHCCNEKIVRGPSGNKTLIFHSNGSKDANES
nr:hypothetical protein [Tanacetum cinerariifolium]